MYTKQHIRLWSGIASGFDGYTYDTAVDAVTDGVVHRIAIIQDGDVNTDEEVIVLTREQAVDIAMAILRDCTPTLHELVLDAFGTGAKHTG